MTQQRPQPAGAPDPVRQSAEHGRLAESPTPTSPWRLWGPYVSGRQWGTVREDYSADGDAWAYLPFEQANARAYRWGEDGLGGICDRFGFLNFGLALWNGKDPILKERLFGLTNGQGNHGEDVKEYWWPTDGTPTHSYMEFLYRYPQAEYPYEQLKSVNAGRGKNEREFELGDTGVLDADRFFDVAVTYAKAAPDDMCIVVTATNHGPDPADLHILPQVWFRNTWSWGTDDRKAGLTVVDAAFSGANLRSVRCDHGFLGSYHLAAEGNPRILVCENETNDVKLFGSASNPTAFTKDGVNEAVVHGNSAAVNPAGTGTKAAFWYQFDQIPSGGSVTVRLRLATGEAQPSTFGTGFAAIMADRHDEADDFYAQVLPAKLSEEDAFIGRRAFAGLLWGKQLYRYDVSRWLTGDPSQPVPPPERLLPLARNVDWTHFSTADVMSMPDEWEYPWFASWDLAFHCVALAHVDPAFAKEQLLLLCREWVMNPNGQLPAYEWAFGDVNPPVHAWAAWQVYLVDGSRDTDFLMRICTKLLLNFSWWINRKDPTGSNLFQGGFLGMDNIGLFNRSEPLPPGFLLAESDATSWMAFFCQQMLHICIELAQTVPAFDDMATKFLEHFLSIATAVRTFGPNNVSLWDEDDGFFYDVLVRPDGSHTSMRVRSMVGLLPLFAVTRIPARFEEALPDMASRLAWLTKKHPEKIAALVSRGEAGGPMLLAAVSSEQFQRIVGRLFDEKEFFSPHGIRSLSAVYATPFTMDVDGSAMTIDYEPGESTNSLFGGNSNWRGPVWFPPNVLMADALRTYGSVPGGVSQVEVPSGSGRMVTLVQAAEEIDRRLIGLFRRGVDGRRPSDGNRLEASDSPLWQDQVTFSEYFHGDTGEGLGASHQTGWTAMVAHLLCQGDEGD